MYEASQLNEKMYQNSCRLFFYFFLFYSINIVQATPLKNRKNTLKGLVVTDLTCEYQRNPLGIESTHPRLGWQLRSSNNERGQYQTSYSIQVASSEKKLLSNNPDIWNSGKNNIKQSNNINYSGKELTSGKRYYWRVKVWDKHKLESDWSKVYSWEMGLIHEFDWNGKWIEDTIGISVNDSMRYGNIPAPIFRKEFAIVKKIEKATLYVTGIGYYEAYLNGNRIGNHLLDPGWTDYSKRVLYSTYDVTSFLHSGANAMGILLGNGWYDPLPLLMWGRINIRKGLTVGNPTFIVQMNIQYSDGSVSQINSDTSWKTTAGPIVRNSIYLGEVYDARSEVANWNQPGINTDRWRKVTIANAPNGKLHSQQQPPIIAADSLMPLSIKEINTGHYIVDFGRNFSGIIKLKAKGKSGSVIQIRYGELLHQDGSLNMMTAVAGQIKRKNIGGIGAPDTAYSKDVFILSGREEEIFQTHFTFHGFRYAELQGYPGILQPEDIKGLILYSDVAQVGSFSCSDSTINQLQQVCRNTFLSNIFSVQSDCPDREKYGYGGDIVATSESFMNNFNMSRFYEKTVIDFADAARPDGGLTETAPHVGISDRGLGGKSGPVEWGSVLPVLMQQLYQYYGNIALIKQQYPVAKKWVDFMTDHADHGIISKTIGDHESIDSQVIASSATAFYYHNTILLTQFARLLQIQTDVEKYGALAEEIKAAFIAKFFQASTGYVDIHTAAAQAYALYFNLIPKGTSESVLNILLKEITIKNKGHISSGIFGTKFILEEVSKAGYFEVIHKMVTNKTYPGWGYMLEKGATTLWEHWAYSENVYSHNHPMFGTVSEWFYRYLAGIRPADDAVGFNKIVIQPQISTLQWAKASYLSVHGNILSSWKKTGEKLWLEIEVPVNTNSIVYIPGQLSDIKEGSKSITSLTDIHFMKEENNHSIFQIGSGKYQFSVDLSKKISPVISPSY